MVTQETLKTIRENLYSTFSTFTTELEIKSFVEKEMKVFFAPGLYTDNKCSTVYDKAIKHLEKDIKEKYDNIANQINEYIDEINKEFQTDHTYSQSNADTLAHIAVGAGAGLGAAILFGGPVGWMIGIGAGIAAIYSSEKKKKELISRIKHEASKLNDEIIQKIKDILDLYIIDDEVLLPVATEEIIEFSVDMIENLSDKQIEIKTFLENRGIKYLVHFTDSKNYDSIQKYGICSPKEGKKLGLCMPINNIDISSHRADKYMKSTNDDYISLSITEMNEKVLSAFKARNKIKQVKRILIDANILWKEINNDRIYCNMNASAGSLSCGNSFKNLEDMFSPSIEQVKYTGEKILSTRIGKDTNITTHSQAEILWQSNVDPKYIINDSTNYYNDLYDKDELLF